MEKSIIIIGAGIAGLSTGCYAQMNDYSTHIFEMHDKPGGLCTAWKRNGYIIDGCIHHLGGASSNSRFYRVWEELGAVQNRPMVFNDLLVTVRGPDGETFDVFTNIDRLEQHMKELSPADAKVIEEYVNSARVFTRLDLSALPLMKPEEMTELQPFFRELAKWGGITMEEYGARFTDSFLRRAFPVIQYGSPGLPVVINMIFLASCHNRTFGWPRGGSLEFSQAIERRYLDLGGEMHYRSQVVKIPVENKRAVGVRLADGTEHRADLVISAADGHSTIFQMLDGKYINDAISAYYARPPSFQKVNKMDLQVSFGVVKDISKEPPAMACLLEKPISIADRDVDTLEVEIFGYDPSLAPAGKGVVKVVIDTSYAYWKNLAADRKRYEAEKDNVASTIIDQLEKFLPGLKKQVEITDVATPLTVERYTGNWQGLQAWPPKGELEMTSAGFIRDLPGLENFYMAGQWADGISSLVSAAVSGRKLIQFLCERDGKQFVTTIP
ncbi:MAG: NAD(P)/FAD-dependent oxidoreductase [Methanotrichaceae archaeon]|nr:NAD(P)/FAD-dependent oxidoreductase [Methanotrichaceae archaeon]